LNKIDIMKLKYFVFLLVFSLSLPTLFAQQPERIQRGQRGYIPPSTRNFNNTYIELRNVREEVNIMVPKCEQAFGLDAFQKEILKSLLTKRFEDENAIVSDEDNSKDERQIKLRNREVQFYSDLESILSLEQIDEFKNMDFSETTEDKKKKRKKRKKDKKKNI